MIITEFYKTREDGVVLDWVPCRNADGTEGFYDNVTGAFVAPV